jgi:hypothetical protein
VVDYLESSQISIETIASDLIALQNEVFTKEGRHKQLLGRLAEAFKMGDANDAHYESLKIRIKTDNLFDLDLFEAIKVLKKLQGVNVKAENISKFLKSISDDAHNEKKKRYTLVGSVLSFAVGLSVILIASGGDRIGAYGLQVICNCSKAMAWMSNNVLRTRFNIDFGPSFVGLLKTFFFMAFPFVLPEYVLMFASMHKARAAGMTIPYLLNFGLATDKFVQYLLAYLSGESASAGDWLSLFGIIVSVSLGAAYDVESAGP